MPGIVSSFRHHQSPLRGGRRRSQAQKAQRRREDDRHAQLKSRHNDDRVQEVRQNVPAQDPNPAGPGQLCQSHKFLLFEAHGLNPDDLGVIRPAGDSQHKHHSPAALAQNHAQAHSDQGIRDREHRICEAHEQRVHGPAHVSGKNAHQCADTARDQNHSYAHHHGRPGACHQSAENIPAQAVCSQQVLHAPAFTPGRRDQVLGQLPLSRGMRGNQLAEQAGKYHRPQNQYRKPNILQKRTDFTESIFLVFFHSVIPPCHSSAGDRSAYKRYL